MRDRLSRLFNTVRATVVDGLDAVNGFLDEQLEDAPPCIVAYGSFAAGIAFSLAVHFLITHV